MKKRNRGKRRRLKKPWNTEIAVNIKKVSIYYSTKAVEKFVIREKPLFPSEVEYISAISVKQNENRL